MARIVVRNLDETVKSRHKRPATLYGRTMEAEVRQILSDAARESGIATQGFGTRIAARFAGIGLAEDFLELRGHRPRPAKFTPGK